MLWRLWWRPDRRFMVAAAGIAAAILLPIAGTLVLQGLDLRVDDGWIAYRADGGELPDLGYELAIRLEGGVAAIVEGDPLVPVDGATVAGIRDRVVDIDLPDIVPSGTPLVHPATLSGSAPHVGLLDRSVDAPGVIVAPARGADAFEQASIDDLQSQTLLLVLASVPAVALVALVFADQEARRLARPAATLAALGRTQLGRRIIALRVLWLTFVGASMGTGLGFLLWRFGGAAFKPEDTIPLGIAIAIAVPSALGGGLGVLWGVRRLGSGEERLRSPPGDSDLPGARIPWLPVILRPLTLGTRLLPVLGVAGLLFAVNLAFPIAAASVPAAVAGQPGEWVAGADAGITIGGNTDAGPADVLWRDPAIDAIVAEIMLPTLVAGTPVLVRGGELEQLAAYHDLSGIDGDGLWLGAALAGRLGLSGGETVSMQAGHVGRVAFIEVAGVFSTGGMLRDEAVLDADTARELSGVADGRATLLRIRPDSDAARDAISRSAPDIQVTDLRFMPEAPVAGRPVQVSIEVANMGANAGERVLPVRVNGLVAAEVTARVPGWGTATLTTTVIAPEGRFLIQVNPTVFFEAQPGDTIQAPPIVFLPDNITVEADGAEAELLLDGAVVDTAPLQDGSGTLHPQTTGRHEIAVGDARRTILVSPDALRNVTDIRFDTAWITPSNPSPGDIFSLHIAATNHGGIPGTGNVPYTIDGAPFNATFRLLSGRSGVIEAPFYLEGGGMDILVGEQRFGLGGGDGGFGRLAQELRAAQSLQVEVADRVLGDAQRALVGLATISLASILAVVYLGTERTLQGRSHVLRTLHAMGTDAPQIRYRAAWEAGILAALAFLVSALLAKLSFIALGGLGWPRPFGHALPDPVSWLFVMQAGAAFIAVAALAAYLASGRLVSGAAGAAPRS